MMDDQSAPLSRKQRNREARKERKLAHKRAKKSARLEREAKRGAMVKAHPTVLLRMPTADDAAAAASSSSSEASSSLADAERCGAERTPALEIEHVRRVYDAIAQQWHGTRYKAWPRVKAFVDAQREGALVGDFGAGNGKNVVGTTRPLLSVGCDSSVELCKIAASRGVEMAVADATALPYRSDVFDCVS